MYALHQTGQFVAHSHDILFLLLRHSASQVYGVLNSYYQPEVILLFEVKRAKNPQTPKPKNPSEIS